MSLDKIVKKINGGQKGRSARKSKTAERGKNSIMPKKAIFNASKNRKKEDVGGWYDDRYQTVIVQRNIAAILFCVSMICIVVVVLVLMRINSTRKLEPFVVEVNRKSGVTTVVDLNTKKQYTGMQSVNDYFLVLYLRNRELYDPANYRYNWYTVVRTFSNNDVYRVFNSLLRSDDSKNPINFYAGVTNMDLKIRSIQYLSDDSAQIRFNISTDNGRVINKVALIGFEYTDSEMPQSQRYINPLGFRITSYRVTDEYLH